MPLPRYTLNRFTSVWVVLQSTTQRQFPSHLRPQPPPTPGKRQVRDDTLSALVDKGAALSVILALLAIGSLGGG